MTGTLIDQQLIIHAYAPTDGPNSRRAYMQVRELWSRCRDRLGVRVPIVGLPATLPIDLDAAIAQPALAALEDNAAVRQMIVRRVHDVINFSMVFSTPQETSARRRRIGSAAPPGWIEFDRWWDEIAAEETDALLGLARVYLAATSGVGPDRRLVEMAAAVRTALPPAVEAPLWWDRGQVHLGEFAMWEWSPDDDARPERRIAILGGPDRDAELSAWTWSNGQPALPPLARYLAHAAKVRYEARTWGDGHDVDELRRRVDDCVDQLRRILTGSAGVADQLAAERRLQAEEAHLVTAIKDVREMRHAVEIAKANLDNSNSSPLRSDLALAEWLAQALDDAAELLHAARQAATDVGQIARQWSQPGADADSDTGSGQTSRSNRARVTIRMGFGIDIVEYSSRSFRDRDDAQQRVASMIRDVLAELGLRLEDTEHQDTGDGMNVFLPPSVEIHRSFPRLLQYWREFIAADNSRYRDRLRLRMAFGVGPVGVSALGFSDKTVVEVSRLLDSDVLREAMIVHSDADLAVLISDQLYKWGVGEGHPGLDPAQFQRVQATAKAYSDVAWLWVAR